jgi:hypothetical protein
VVLRMAITFQGRWRLHGRGTKERNIGTKHRGPEIKIRDRGSKAWGKGVILVIFVLGGPSGSKAMAFPVVTVASCQNSPFDRGKWAGLGQASPEWIMIPS